MNHHSISNASRRAAGWLLGLALLFAGLQAFAQQDPPGRVARLNFHQGTVSFSPAGEDSWYEVSPNRPITTGDRLWTDRNARAELYVGSSALRLDDQTAISVAELDDDTARVTAMQGSLQLRVRDDPAGERIEIDTGNLAVVVEAPGDYRIEADAAAGTTRVAVATGRVTLYGENGESVPLGARQQLTLSGRNLSTVSGAPVRAGDDFDRWVAERDRIEDQSISARYVSREVVGYQQLDNYGDWQNVPEYGNVWYPRNVDADWAPYRDGQWVDVAPWGWTWVDAAPWGFAPSHYGRWARIGPRWGWVPGRPNARPVYAPALVGFVGGANFSIGGGRHGVGWFPLAPGEPWRPGYRASQRYIDQANRAAAHNRRLANEFAHRNTPGAVTLVPVDVFGRGQISRRDFVRMPQDRTASIPVGNALPIPLRGDHRGFGRPAAVPPLAAMQAQQFQFQQREALRQQQQQMQAGQAAAFDQRRQLQQQDAARQQQFQQRGAQAAQSQQLQLQQAQQAQQAQQLQQREAMRQQQEVQQRAAQAQQMQQAQQIQQAQQVQQREAARQQPAQQRAAQAQAQQMQQAQQLQQQRAAQAQAQAQQQMQLQQQQQVLRQQQETQQRAAQAQAQQALHAQQQMQQAQQQNAMRQMQEGQQRALQQAQQYQQQRGAQAQAQRGQGREQQQAPPDRP